MLESSDYIGPRGSPACPCKVLLLRISRIVYPVASVLGLLHMQILEKIWSELDFETTKLDMSTFRRRDILEAVSVPCT